MPDWFVYIIHIFNITWWIVRPLVKYGWLHWVIKSKVEEIKFFVDKENTEHVDLAELFKGKEYETIDIIKCHLPLTDNTWLEWTMSTDGKVLKKLPVRGEKDRKYYIRHMKHKADEEKKWLQLKSLYWTNYFNRRFIEKVVAERFVMEKIAGFEKWDWDLYYS